MPLVFCVEDDSAVRDLMAYTLSVAGYETAGFEDGASFFNALKESEPDLILLDIMLPGEDGIQILKKLKASSNAQIPVIMTTAKGTEYDKVLGLDLGADDYLVKPFGMMEMLSRVKAVLRRAAPKAQTVLTCGPLTLSPAAHTLTIDGNPVALTLKEFELLRLFMQNPQIVFTREQLLESVWGIDFTGETRTVDVHIGTLRTKLGEYASYIKTVRGVGYRLNTVQKS